MATAKIDKILTSFLSRIGDPATFSGSVLQDGNILTASEAMEYVNKALHELFRKYWELTQGDKKKFAEIFPELFKRRVVIVNNTDGKTKYAVANPNLDYFALLDAITNTVAYIQVLPATLYHTVLSENHPYYVPTLSRPAIIDVDKTLFVFPKDYVGSGLSTSITISIIVLPLDPTTGAFLAQNGSYDSPYYDHWNEEIVNIATEMYKQDLQRDS
jgi:hypothetical protein